MLAAPAPRSAARALAWLTRLLFALVVMTGAMATAGATPIEVECDPAEEGEDSESLQEEGFEIRATRRQAGSATPPYAGEAEWLTVPRALGPTRAAPPPPSWLRPRRTPPPDDDDESKA